MTKRESSLLWSLERGLGIALQAMLEKKAVMLRKRGRLVGFLELRRPWGFSPEARRGSQGARVSLIYEPEIPVAPGEKH